ncbi:hypothetical protein BH09PAT4_BH09PAT4_00460 [soil metagenome]
MTHCRYDKKTMILRQPRVNWSSVWQILLASLLIAVGVRLLSDASYTALTVRNHNVVPRPPYAARRVPPFRFPDGSRQLFPGQRLVALYGAPGAPVLGALGRQDINASLKRVQVLSRQYQPYSSEHILPTFEIIATVASASPTENNDYSREIPIRVLSQWVDAARQAGVYVVLDVQPGRSDFLSQVKSLRPLLLQPHVGIALDPEWRLKPNQVPLAQIGTVPIAEVNAVANWLANLTSTQHLPQKLFLLHQFRTDMLPGRIHLKSSHPELASVIQMDGQGSQPQKQDTWHAILRQPPPNTKFGWKNFYLKDTTLLTPAQTMQISPKPWYISYQ